MKKLLTLILVGFSLNASAQITQNGKALTAFGGTTNDTAAVQAVINALPATGGVLKFQPGVVYKLGAAGLQLTNFTNLEVDFNGAQIQALADSTNNDGVNNSFFVFTNCTNCKVHGGNFDGKTFKGGFLAFSGCTDDEVYSNTSSNVGRASNGVYQFSSSGSTRMRWHDNTAIGHVNVFNGTITAASGTSATLTVNSTAYGTVGTGQTLGPSAENSLQTTTITSGTSPTFTITCTTTCANVSASTMLSYTTNESVRGFWFGNTNVGLIDIDDIIGPNNKAIRNVGSGFVLSAAGAQVIGNYASNNIGSGFLSSTATSSQSVDHNFVGNNAIGNTQHGYQTDVTSAVPVLRVTLSGNRFESNVGNCMYLNYAQYFSISGNLCVKNDTGVANSPEIGLYGLSNQVSITGNTLLPNSAGSDAGVLLSSAAAYTFTDITISGNNITCPANSAGTAIQAQSANTSTFARISIMGNVLSTCNTGTLIRATAAGDTYGDVAIIGNHVTNMGSGYFIRFIGATANQITNARVIGNSGETTIHTDANTILTANYGNAWNVATMTAPTISSGFGTSPSVTKNYGYSSFSVNVGTGGVASSGVVGLPTAVNGWACTAADVTTPATNMTQQSASSTTTATFVNYLRTTGVAAAWTASDILQISCAPN